MEHTYVVSDESRECVIIDPGFLYAEERNAVATYIEKEELTPRAIWLTHSHFDHVWGVAFAKEKWGIEVFASKEDAFLKEVNREMTGGWRLPEPAAFDIEHDIKEGDVVCFGKCSFRVISTPGHTPGGLSFYCADEGVCFTGDTLFRYSVGRTDFPRGSQTDVVNSVRSKLLVLPEETKILAGHGPDTVVKDEILGNPYINAC